MKRRLLTLSLAFAIVLTPFGPAVHGKKKPDQTPDKVKAEVESRINKKEEQVKVKLRSGSEVKGRITQSSANGFTVVEDKSGSRTEIAYTDVSNVEGRGMSKTKKTLIGVSIAAGIVMAAFAYAFTHIWD
jgi:small nuclear ribonucleoprotein (snRNP)-like protein